MIEVVGFCVLYLP